MITFNLIFDKRSFEMEKVLDQNMDTVIDICIENPKFSVEENGSINIDANEITFLSLFDFVTFLNPNCKTLMQVFTKYDGKVIAYSNNQKE